MYVHYAGTRLRCVCVCVCVCVQSTHKAGDVSEEPHRLVNGRSVLSAEIEALH